MRQLSRGLILITGVLILVSSVNLTIARQDTPQEWLYFSDTSGGLFRMHPDGGQVETMVENMIIDDRILWSDDGQWLYFSGYDSVVGPMLYRFNVYDQRLEELMPSGGQPQIRSWSPDGEWLHVNDSYGDGLNFLVLMRPDGSDNHSPIPDISYSIFSGWSPDSQWLLFAAFHESGSDLYVVRPDGNDLQNLTRRAEVDYNGWITPDGEWIIYNADQNSDTEIYRMHWDGSEQQNLTNTPEHAERLEALSPDGAWAVFSAITDNGYDYFRMHVDGTDELQLTTFEGTGQFHQWSPDGAWLYFDVGHAEQAEIFRVHIDTGEIQPLTDNSVFDTFQQLSSDGHWLIYTSGRADGIGELRVMDVETVQSTLLAEFPFWIELGDFSPDGDWFYFTLPDDELVLQLHRVRLDGTELEKLTNSAGDKAFLTWSQALEKT